MNKESIIRGINELAGEHGEWYQDIDICGVPTRKERSASYYRYEEVKTWLPDDLTGKRVVEAGCNAGAMCFYCEEMGADVDGFEPSAFYYKQAMFAKDAKGSGVNFYNMNFEDSDKVWSPSEKPFADYALCISVIYHVENPILFLRKIYAILKVGGELIIEICPTALNPEPTGRALSFRVMTNALFVPTLEAMIDMLDYVGFKVCESRETFGGRQMIRAVRGGDA